MIISTLAELFYLIMKLDQMENRSTRACINWLVLEMGQGLFGVIWPSDHAISIQERTREASGTEDAKKALELEITWCTHICVFFPWTKRVGQVKE